MTDEEWEERTAAHVKRFGSRQRATGFAVFHSSGEIVNRSQGTADAGRYTVRPVKAACTSCLPQGTTECWTLDQPLLGPRFPDPDSIFDTEQEAIDVLNGLLKAAIPKVEARIDQLRRDIDELNASMLPKEQQ
jgi:hypothetical protein